MYMLSQKDQKNYVFCSHTHKAESQAISYLLFPVFLRVLSAFAVQFCPSIRSKAFTQNADMYKRKGNNPLSISDHHQECGVSCYNPRGGAISESQVKSEE